MGEDKEPLILPNFVHDCNAGLLGLLVQFEHCGRDVTGCDDMLLVSNSRLDDSGVEGVGDQTDDQVVLCNLSIESFVVCDVERDWIGVLDSCSELLGTFEGSACYELVSSRS